MTRTPRYVRIETIYAVPIAALALCAFIEALGRIFS